ncbi:alpha-L-fucosidase [Fulvivirgaceae bacterium BMA10]|uniref:alpha-L-fucosidase n=1 Tax=Splendidivirga corallicola TaxID=3051826 RepID=A0ABT8KUD1_9BACT|nr:alpha-L-fucosidase [Fulvivirgaceae bacterium BMA10]
MNRINFNYLILLIIILGCQNKQNKKVGNSTLQQENLVLPTSKQVEWADAEIGVLIHFDINVYEPEYNWRGDWDYNPDPKIFNPTELDTDQWIQAAKAAGANYAVLVAKHCTGFSLWPTEAHSYSVKSSPWKNGQGDIVADFIASCKKYGVKPGIYASAAANGYFKVDNPGLVITGDSIAQKAYNKVVEMQLTELWSNYGDLFEIWFDGGVLPKSKGGPDIVPILQEKQPDAVVFQGPYGTKNLVRWVGNEEGLAAYPSWATADSTTKADGTVIVEGLHGNPEAPIWCPGEADAPLRKNSSWQGGWFWKEGEDHMINSLDEMIHKYYHSVGRNTNLLIGIVVDTRGLVPDADVKALKAFGDETKKRFDTSLAETVGEGNEVIINFDTPTEVNHIVIMEDIAKGERIRKYNIEGRVNGVWKLLAEGESVGHKRIQEFKVMEVSGIRLSVSESIATPKIKRLAVYHIK